MMRVVGEGGRRTAASPLRRSPRVSVIIPSHQYGRFLGATLGSVLSQDGVDLDVLVIDDGSTDDSVAVARRVASDDPRVEVRVHKHNIGHIQTFNEGIAWASGEYVVLLGSDDVLPEGALARSTALLEAHPEVGLAYGWGRTFRTPEPPPVRGHLRGWTLWDGRQWMRSRFERGESGIRSPEAVVRRSVHDEIGDYNVAYPRTADFDVWMRCAAVADVGRVDGIEQAFYRLHPAQMTSTIHSDPVYKLERRREIFERVVERGVLPDGDGLYRRATRALAGKAIDWAARDPDPAHDDVTARLVAFALTLDPGVRRRPDWWRLKLRLRLLRRAPRLSRLLGRRAVRAALVHHYWRLRGSP